MNPWDHRVEPALYPEMINEGLGVMIDLVKGGVR
jgi:hypothetical protein